MCRPHHAAPPIQQQHLEHDDLARQARCEQHVAAVAHARLQPALKLSSRMVPLGGLLLRRVHNISDKEVRVVIAPSCASAWAAHAL